MKIKMMAMFVFSLVGLLGSLDSMAAFLDVTNQIETKNNQGKLTLYKNREAFDVKFGDVGNVESVFYVNHARRDVGSQRPSNIGEVVENLFDLSEASLVDKGKNSRIASNKGPFTYLAVHLTNNRELFFKFLMGIESFNLKIDGQKDQITNWRAFNDVTNVPVPAALWLFAPALAGMAGFSKKRKTLAA
jgi:hypothetical protein